MLQGAWSRSVAPTDPFHQRAANEEFWLWPTTIRSTRRLLARRTTSSTGSPTARWPMALKPRSRSVRMPSSRTACVRFFSSSSSSSGTKPSVRKSDGGMLATASTCVSACRKLARSALSRSARLPSCEPLYARRIFWYFMRASVAFPLVRQQPDALDSRAFRLERLSGPFRVVLARLIPVGLVEELQRLVVFRVVHRQLEGVVQRFHHLRRHALGPDQPERRIGYRVHAELGD